MKKFVLILFLISSHLIISQDIENPNWLIKKLVIDNTDYPAPINNESPSFFMALYWDIDIWVFDNYHCGRLDSSTGGVWYDDETLYLGFLDVSFEQCNIPENTTFSNLHFNFYLEDTDTTYNYSISNTQNNEMELILTNEFGNQAYYTSPLLNTNSNINSQISIYPTISSDFIKINYVKPIFSLAVFNLSGQKVLKQFTNTKNIDVSMLPDGMYFLQIVNEEGSITKKFVKK